MGNFNYHFDETVIKKDTNYTENSGKMLKHSGEVLEENALLNYP